MTLILAILAMTTLRMKCFWGPYICIFAAVMVADKDIWTLVANTLSSSGNNKQGNRDKQENWKLVLFMRHIMIVLVMTVLYNSFKDGMVKELENLRWAGHNLKR